MQFISAPMLNTERQGHGISVIGGSVYVICGFNGSYLDSIEVLNIAKNETVWK